MSSAAQMHVSIAKILTGDETRTVNRKQNFGKSKAESKFDREKEYLSWNDGVEGERVK